MKRNAPLVTGILSLLVCFNASAQKMSIAQMKKALDSSTNGPLYAKTVLKKQIVIDTIVIQSLSRFQGVVDSLAYHGKVGKNVWTICKRKSAGADFSKSSQYV